jgi:hypothetical protein
MDRRDFLQKLGMSATVLTLSSSLWQVVNATTMSELSDTDRMLYTELASICDLVLPDTETLGAKSVEVQKWLLLASRHELEGVTYVQLLDFIKQLNQTAQFSTLSNEQQLSTLSPIDTLAFARGATQTDMSGVWKKLKSLILTGYYTSKVGGCEELRYKLVHGEMQADTKVDPKKVRAWSSDWIAVSLG